MKKKQIQFKIWLPGLLIFIAPLLVYPLVNTSNTDQTLERLSPFIGKWETESLFPDSGKKVHGELEYCWILGKKWIKVEFKGNHPERDYWEAYAMIKFDQEINHYRSYDFFSSADPIKMLGQWISPDTIRFEYREEKQHLGIDYTLRNDGTIFQENWQMTADQQKKITLQTEYRRFKK